MQKTVQGLAETRSSLSLWDLERYAQGWLLDSEIRQHSPNTLSSRRIELEKLVWFLKQQERPSCGTMELRQFFSYLTHGHEQPGGRWGNPRMNKPVRPRTVKGYLTKYLTS